MKRVASVGLHEHFMVYTKLETVLRPLVEDGDRSESPNEGLAPMSTVENATYLSSDEALYGNYAR